MTVKHVQEVLTDKQWKGEPVFIIGGGPSAKTFPVGLLKESKVIGCNQAWKMSIVDIVVILDRRVIDLARKTRGWDSSECVKLYSLGNLNYDYPETAWLPSIKPKWGKSLSEGVIRKRCAGIQATNLATILGAGAVFLIGFDHGGVNGKTHWHNDYKEAGWGPDIPKFSKLGDEWARTFENHIKDIPCPIFNLNPKSRLKVFPRISPEKGIEIAARMADGSPPTYDPKDIAFYG